MIQLQSLEKAIPEDEFFFLIIGNDQFYPLINGINIMNCFPRWFFAQQQGKKIKKKKLFLFAEKLLNGKSDYYLAAFEPIVISSSEIREKIKNQDDFAGFVPADVCKYIKDKGFILYNNDEFIKIIKGRLSEKRFQHSMNVAASAKALAKNSVPMKKKPIQQNTSRYNERGKD